MGLSLKCGHFQMKLLTSKLCVLYKVTLTFGYTSEIPKCGHLNESHRLSRSLLCGAS